MQTFTLGPQTFHPLYELMRPRRNRDDLGSRGESLYKVADWLEANKPLEIMISTATMALQLHAAATVMDARPSQKHDYVATRAALTELQNDPYFKQEAA